MKTRFITLDAILADFVEDNDVRQEDLDEGQLKKWGADCVPWFLTDDQWTAHRTRILDVDRYKAKAPADLVRIGIVAGREYPKKGTLPPRREQISQWIQHTFDPDQKLEINLINKGCKDADCLEDNGFVEVDVDRLWEMSHPEIYYSGFTKKFTWGYGGNTVPEDYKFRVLSYSTNSYFGLQKHIPDCLNIKAPDINGSYVLNLPYIETSFEKGELLLSYFGRPVDDNGDIMVPDHPSAIEAVFFYMTYKWFWREYSRTGDRVALQKVKVAEEAYLRAIDQARSVLTQKDPDEMSAILEKNWAKRVPNYSPKDSLNRNRPDDYDTYANMMKY